MKAAIGALLITAVAVLAPIVTGRSESPARAVVGAAPATTDCGIQRQIDEAIRDGTKVLRLVPGARCRADPLVIRGAKNLTIDGQGGTLIFSATQKAGVRITASSGVKLVNLVIDYAPLPFTQGRVVAGSPGELRFVLDAGYPSLAALPVPDRALIFDAATGRFKADASTIYFRTMRPDSDGRGGAIGLPLRYLGSVSQGDKLVLAPRGAPAIQLDGLARDVALSGVTIHAAPGMALMARFVDGRNYFRVNVVPGPPPAPGAAVRLISSNADAINYAYARNGPVIEQSRISRQGDDAVNLHGLVLGVIGRPAPDRLLLARPFGSDGSLPRLMRTGDPVRLLEDGSFAVSDTGRLASIVKRPNDRDIDWAALDRLYPRSHLGGQKKVSLYLLSLSEPLRGPVAYVEFPALAANGFVIRNNLFTDNRGHGIVSGSSFGLIDHNRIERTTHNAIILGPNFSPWREGGWVENVTVQNNSIRAPCGDRSTVSGDYWSSGSIAVSAMIDDRRARQSGNHRISLNNNLIADCRGTAIAIDHSDDMKVANNVLIPPRNAGSACLLARLIQGAEASSNRCQE